MKRLVLMIVPALICGVAVFTSCNSKAETDEVNWTNKIEELFEHNKNKISLSEGIWGTLLQGEGCGNMHIPGEGSSCKLFPVKREIVIYEYATFNESIQSTQLSGAHFEKIHTKLVATTICDKEGFFEVELKPGRYSVFVKDFGALRAAGGVDGYGGLSPVLVEPLKVSEMNLRVYK